MKGENMMNLHKKTKTTIMFQPDYNKSDESFDVQSKQSQVYKLNSS